MSATVDRYLAAINAPKKRGRKVTKATLETRLADARAQSKTATGVDKVLAAQEVRREPRDQLRSVAGQRSVCRRSQACWDCTNARLITAR